ncbi:putative eggshell protein [Trichoplusia ni]|uniref:Eggshell protein n=1 Tax=Trichoplusia ni TaxID=7111 RepID=A0A7E5VM94_TRINI|nr:putative eggshell protein [Trichoplusia ni]XP_026729404.1 putative eggshell protein [Trichoplusia ni]
MALCDSPPSERGYDTVERHISWMYHPSGPADNERKAASLKYPPGKSEGHSQDRETGNNYGGSKNIERHLPETFGGLQQTKEKYGVEKISPVKYGVRQDKFGAEKHGPERYEAQKYGPEKYGPEKYGPEKYGPEKYGPEKYGQENHESEKYGPEKYVPEKYESEKYGPEKYGPEMYGPQKYGPSSQGQNPYRGHDAGRFQVEHFSNNDRYRAEPAQQIEQFSPNEKFVVRPQRPLHT